MTEPWWQKTAGSDLAQGDLLEDCRMPIFSGSTEEEIVEEEFTQSRLLVISQSCDLVNKKIEYVALCPIFELNEFEEINPKYSARGKWEAVRKGQHAALHLLASPEDPNDNRSALVVDFGQIVSLPIEYLSRHAEELGERWRLRSPFLEHFSQALARFFMRVGLPSDIPPFN